MLPRNLTLILTALVVSVACYILHQRTRTALLVGEALDTIDMFYVEPVDRRQLLISAMNGMTATLDPHSEFIPPRQYTAFQDSIQQEFAGIGIHVIQTAPDQPVMVVTPLVGSPALEAGLKPGDLIVEVDGEDVSSMDIENVSSRLKGPIGTTVSLSIRRGEDRLTMTIARATIQLESVIGDYRDEQNRWVFHLRERPEIAYIRLTSFGERTVRELQEVVRSLESTYDALILDLRGNGGGLLDSAVEVSDMFLDSGRIVSTKIRGGRIEQEWDAAPGTLVDPKIPVAVLVDHDSASASEIVAAALQDHDRATIVGTRTFGKGTVQNILPLEYGRSALRLTVAKYYRPSDVNIHRDTDDTEADPWGVTPNEGYIVELDEPTLIRLSNLWQQASYPSLKSTPLPESITQMQVPVEKPGDAPEKVPVVETATNFELDAQLQRAVEAVTSPRS